MSDVTMADCRVLRPGKPSRPLTSADLDSLIRERGVTDEMVERAARGAFLARYPDGNWGEGGQERPQESVLHRIPCCFGGCVSGQEGGRPCLTYPSPKP